MNSHQYWVEHFSSATPEINKTFVGLTPDSCKEIIKDYHVPSEKGIVFESAENRVFGFGDLILKFYRPGRWSLDALSEEVQFLRDLEEENLPVVRPLGDVNTWNGIHYVAYQAIEKPYIDSPEVLGEKSSNYHISLQVFIRSGLNAKLWLVRNLII